MKTIVKEIDEIRDKQGIAFDMYRDRSARDPIQVFRYEMTNSLHMCWIQPLTISTSPPPLPFLWAFLFLFLDTILMA